MGIHNMSCDFCGHKTDLLSSMNSHKPDCPVLRFLREPHPKAASLVPPGAIPSLEARMLYMNSPELHAAVQSVWNLARTKQGDELLDYLIQFFADYDRLRTDEIESLKTQLTDALMWQVKPFPIHPR